MSLDSGSGNENSKEGIWTHTNTLFWTSLVAQWLRPHTAKAGSMSLIPGQETKILYAAVAGKTTPQKQ